MAQFEHVTADMIAMTSSKSETRPPIHNIPTPSRGGRGGDRADRGERRDRQNNALEDIMRRKGVDEAWNALEDMQKQGTQTDKYTISRMLMKTVGDGRSRLNTSRVYRGIALVEKFIDMQPKDVDEVLLNALLDTCCRLKDLTRLESTVQRMRELKVTPSPVTLGILVKTYGQAGDIQKVLSVWDEMEKQRGQANAVTYGCMIDACVKCSRLDKAVEIFQGMRESGKHRNTILYTTLIKGYGLEKNLRAALDLFREMPSEGVPYNTITYNSMIDACVKGGDLVTAEQLLQEITSHNSPLEPDLITFSTLLKGYCHAGDLDKALQLAEAIKARGLRCDELVYNTLMDGCVKANDVSAGVGLFEEMVQTGMRPSAITHSILVRLYQRAGYEDDASEAVAQLYNHHGIERPTAGDKRDGRGRGQRSPLGRASPTASPMSGYGGAYWNTWEQMGFAQSMHPSAASTPCGSPTHHIGQPNGVFLPMDAMRSVPPLPGMGGSETPGGASFSAPSPMNGGYTMPSPCMSPMHMDQSGQGLLLPTGSPQVMMAPAPAALPAFPFNGPGFQQQADGQVPQFVPMAMTAPAGMLPTMSQPGVASNIVNASTAAGGCTPHPDSVHGVMCMGQQSMMAPGASTPTAGIMSTGPMHWVPVPQDQQQQLGQGGFPMPLSPPVDQNCNPNPQMSQGQAYFEMMPADANKALGQPNPFCL